MGGNRDHLVNFSTAGKHDMCCLQRQNTGVDIAVLVHCFWNSYFNIKGWSFVQNKTHYVIIHHAFTIQYITLLSKYIKWISRGISLKAFTHVNTSLCHNGSLVSRVWTASNYSKDYYILKFSRKILNLYRVTAVIIGFILTGLMYDTAHNSLVT